MTDVTYPLDPHDTPTAITANDIAANLASVRERIANACRSAGRDPAEVRLLPVSKTVPEDRIRMAYSAGCRFLGENKVQEAMRKHDALPEFADLKWSVIGHLQTNKARHVARFASEFQALDSLRVAEALDRRLEGEDRSIDVFVQVNSSNEESKFGLAPADVPAFVQELPNYPRLRVQGLMTLALFSTDMALVRPCFVRMRELRDRLLQEAPDGVNVTGLSMGMSGDFELAIHEGATVVRVGQSIFGGRTLPDTYYWPKND